MNPFEEFLRRLFGGGPPPTMQEEEQQAARLPQVARNMASVAADIGRSFVEAYKQRSLDLQDLANRQAGGAFGMYQPLSDYGEDPRAAELARAQRDLALDVLSAGAMGPATSASMGMLSSAPGIGGSTARNALLESLRQIPYFQPPYQQYGETFDEAKRNLNRILKTISPPPEVAKKRMTRVGHSSPHLYERPVISSQTMGTGEGNQAFGIGSYNFTNDKTGKWYRELTGMPELFPIAPNLTVDWRAVKKARLIDDPSEKAQKIRELANKAHQREQILFNAYDNMNILDESINTGNPILNRDQVLKLLNGRMQDLDTELKRKKRSLDKTIAQVGNLDYNFTNARGSTPGTPGYRVQTARTFFNQLLDDREKVADFISDVKRMPENATFNLGQKARQATYRGEIYANPNEFLSLDYPFMGLEGRPRDKFLKALDDLGPDVRRAYERATEVSNLSPLNNNKLLMTATYPELKGKTAYDVASAMRNRGFVASEFLDALSRRKNDILTNTSNYVVFDPSRLYYDTVYGSAPFLPLSSVMSQMQKDKEKKKK
jgi:hypothetical protein